MIRTSAIVDKEHLKAPMKYNRSKGSFGTSIFLCTVFALFLINCMVKGIDLLNGFTQFFVLMEITMGYFLFVVLRIMFTILFKKIEAPKLEMSRENVFEDECLSMTTKHSNGVFNRRRRYESITKAVEYKDWFLIYLTEREVAVIKNTDLIEGTPDELREFLKDKLGTRFIKNT